MKWKAKSESMNVWKAIFKYCKMNNRVWYLLIQLQSIELYVILLQTEPMLIVRQWVTAELLELECMTASASPPRYFDIITGLLYFCIIYEWMNENLNRKYIILRVKVKLSLTIRYGMTFWQ